MTQQREARGKRGRVAPGRWLTHVVLAVVLGGVAGWGAEAWLHHHRAAERAALDFPPRSDGLSAILRGLEQDGVYVSPEGSRILDAAGEAKVVAAVRASPLPVYVAVLPPDQHLGLSEVQIGAALEDELPRHRGVLYVWQGPGKGDIEVLGGRFGDVPGFETPQSFVGDPAITLPKAVRAAARTDFYDDGDSGDSGSSDYWGGVPGGSVLGALIGAGVLLVALLLDFVTAQLLGRRLPGRWTWREDDA